MDVQRSGVVPDEYSSHLSCWLRHVIWHMHTACNQDCRKSSTSLKSVPLNMFNCMNIFRFHYRRVPIRFFSNGLSLGESALDFESFAYAPAFKGMAVFPSSQVMRYKCTRFLDKNKLGRGQKIIETTRDNVSTSYLPAFCRVPTAIARHINISLIARGDDREAIK